MRGFSFAAFFLLLSTASSQHTTTPQDIMTVDITEEKEIPDINTGRQDDILHVPRVRRSSITDRNMLWDTVVPYTVNRSLELNAKGVILKAHDQFRLKTCIDFTLRDTQDYYISVQKLDGCFSFVGRVPIFNGQTLSIGQFCDTIATVEHEFLHALGFYHEQSRPDRDEFVTIVYENIREGTEQNFDKEDNSSAQGVPYDYRSVMHYGKNAFTNGNGSTIITRDSRFQDVIGQRRAMSPSDAKELNLRYNCNDSVAFQMHCDFSDEAMCHMSLCSNGSIEWERVTHAAGGPSSDHTSLPSATVEEVTPEPPMEGHFMHVSTMAGEVGDSALLVTHRMRPKRAGHLQCLQFYYFHNGSADDQLNIRIREFNGTEGFVRLMGQVTGPPTSHWRFHHVSLDPQSDFQVEFEVQKGNGSSSGGISIDDINLSEIECPLVTLQIDEFEQKIRSGDYFFRYIYTPRIYSSEGYSMRFAVQMRGDSFAVRVQMLSGENDGNLTWPCHDRQVTMQVLDQTPNIQHHMSRQRIFTTDPGLNIGGTSVWDNPRKFLPLTLEGELVYGSFLIGYQPFWNLDNLKTHDFLKGGSAVFAFDFQDITPLINGSSLPMPQRRPATIKITPRNVTYGPCTTRPRMLTTVQPTTDKRNPMIHETTADDRTSNTHMTTTRRNPMIHETTADDRSIFDFSPVMMSSPILILLSIVLFWII